MRRLKYPPVQAAADALDAMVAQRAAKARKRSAKARLESAIVATEPYRASGRWDGAGPTHLVGLYAWLHEGVYGVAAEELHDEKALVAALSAAKKLLAQLGIDEAVRFVAWTWMRERRSVMRGKEGRRVTWQVQFACRALLVDYRVAARKGDR